MTGESPAAKRVAELPAEMREEVELAVQAAVELGPDYEEAVETQLRLRLRAVAAEIHDSSAEAAADRERSRMAANDRQLECTAAACLLVGPGATVLVFADHPWVGLCGWLAVVGVSWCARPSHEARRHGGGGAGQ